MATGKVRILILHDDDPAKSNRPRGNGHPSRHSSSSAAAPPPPPRVDRNSSGSSPKTGSSRNNAKNLTLPRQPVQKKRETKMSPTRRAKQGGKARKATASATATKKKTETKTRVVRCLNISDRDRIAAVKDRENKFKQDNPNEPFKPQKTVTAADGRTIKGIDKMDWDRSKNRHLIKAGKEVFLKDDIEDREIVETDLVEIIEADQALVSKTSRSGCVGDQAYMNRLIKAMGKQKYDLICVTAYLNKSMVQKCHGAAKALGKAVKKTPGILRRQQIRELIEKQAEIFARIEANKQEHDKLANKVAANKENQDKINKKMVERLIEKGCLDEADRKKILADDEEGGDDDPLTANSSDGDGDHVEAVEHSSGEEGNEAGREDGNVPSAGNVDAGGGDNFAAAAASPGDDDDDDDEPVAGNVGNNTTSKRPVVAKGAGGSADRAGDYDYDNDYDDDDDDFPVFQDDDDKVLGPEDDQKLPAQPYGAAATAKTDVGVEASDDDGEAEGSQEQFASNNESTLCKWEKQSQWDILYRCEVSVDGVTGPVLLLRNGRMLGLVQTNASLGWYENVNVRLFRDKTNLERRRSALMVETPHPTERSEMIKHVFCNTQDVTEGFYNKLQSEVPTAESYSDTLDSKKAIICEIDGHEDGFDPTGAGNVGGGNDLLAGGGATGGAAAAATSSVAAAKDSTTAADDDSDANYDAYDNDNAFLFDDDDVPAPEVEDQKASPPLPSLQTQPKAAKQPFTGVNATKGDAPKPVPQQPEKAKKNVAAEAVHKVTAAASKAVSDRSPMKKGSTEPTTTTATILAPLQPPELKATKKTPDDKSFSTAEIGAFKKKPSSKSSTPTRQKKAAPAPAAAAAAAAPPAAAAPLRHHQPNNNNSDRLLLQNCPAFSAKLKKGRNQPNAISTRNTHNEWAQYAKSEWEKSCSKDLGKLKKQAPRVSGPRVSFSETVNGLRIPSYKDRDNGERIRCYMGRVELYINAERNEEEREWEDAQGLKWQDAVEEEHMYFDNKTKEYIHPCRYNKQQQQLAPSFPASAARVGVPAAVIVPTPEGGEKTGVSPGHGKKTDVTPGDDGKTVVVAGDNGKTVAGTAINSGSSSAGNKKKLSSSMSTGQSTIFAADTKKCFGALAFKQKQPNAGGGSGPLTMVQRDGTASGIDSASGAESNTVVHPPELNATTKNPGTENVPPAAGSQPKCAPNSSFSTLKESMAAQSIQMAFSGSIAAPAPAADVVDTSYQRACAANSWRASSDVLAGRRIVKIRCPSRRGNAPAAASKKKKNPFANVTLKPSGSAAFSAAGSGGGGGGIGGASATERPDMHSQASLFSAAKDVTNQRPSAAATFTPVAGSGGEGVGIGGASVAGHSTAPGASVSIPAPLQENAHVNRNNNSGGHGSGDRSTYANFSASSTHQTGGSPQWTPTHPRGGGSLFSPISANSSTSHAANASRTPSMTQQQIRDGTGKIYVLKSGDEEILGIGTKFMNEVAAGDFIVCENEKRKVYSVDLGEEPEKVQLHGAFKCLGIMPKEFKVQKTGGGAAAAANAASADAEAHNAGSGGGGLGIGQTFGIGQTSGRNPGIVIMDAKSGVGLPWQNAPSGASGASDAQALPWGSTPTSAARSNDPLTGTEITGAADSTNSATSASTVKNNSKHAHDRIVVEDASPSKDENEEAACGGDSPIVIPSLSYGMPPASAETRPDLFSTCALDDNLLQRRSIEETSMPPTVDTPSSRSLPGGGADSVSSGKPLLKKGQKWG